MAEWRRAELGGQIVDAVAWKITYSWDVENGAFKEKTQGAWDVLDLNALKLFPQNQITPEQAKVAIDQWKRLRPPN